MRLTTSERDALLPRGAKLISLEAGVTTGWERIVGRCGLKIGIDHFGASAPAGDLAEEYGFTPEKVCQRVLNWLKG